MSAEATTPTYDELLAEATHNRRKLADMEARQDEMQATIVALADRLDTMVSQHESADERQWRENMQAKAKSNELARENARIHGADELRREEERRKRAVHIKHTFQLWKKRCEAWLRESDTRRPEKQMSIEYDTWQQEREPWTHTLSEIEDGRGSLAWDSELVDEWMRAANIRPLYQGDRWPYLGLEKLGEVIAEIDERIAAIETRAAAYGLTLDDLRATKLA